MDFVKQILGSNKKGNYMVFNYITTKMDLGSIKPVGIRNFRITG